MMLEQEIYAKPLHVGSAKDSHLATKSSPTNTSGTPKLHGDGGARHVAKFTVGESTVRLVRLR
jgi:hypothetical protein